MGHRIVLPSEQGGATGFLLGYGRLHQRAPHLDGCGRSRRWLIRIVCLARQRTRGSPFLMSPRRIVAICFWVNGSGVILTSSCGFRLLLPQQRPVQLSDQVALEFGEQDHVSVGQGAELARMWCCAVQAEGPAETAGGCAR
jgi:hypothetical protein